MDDRLSEEIVSHKECQRLFYEAILRVLGEKQVNRLSYTEVQRIFVESGFCKISGHRGSQLAIVLYAGKVSRSRKKVYFEELGICERAYTFNVAIIRQKLEIEEIQNEK